MEALMFPHRLVRIEADLEIAAAHRFRLGERKQPPAKSRAPESGVG